MAGMIGPVALCGTVVPAEFEPLPERVFFSAIHYLALVAEPGILAERLRARRTWREWSQPRIAEMLEFNEWLRATAAIMSPPMRLFDTSHTSLNEAVAAAEAWAEPVLSGRQVDGDVP